MTKAAYLMPAVRVSLTSEKEAFKGELASAQMTKTPPRPIESVSGALITSPCFTE